MSEKIVINKTFGGFKLSSFAKEQLGLVDFEDRDIARNDERLIELIEKLGIEKVGGKGTRLKICEIPNNIDWFIYDREGQEIIIERGHVWS